MKRLILPLLALVPITSAFAQMPAPPKQVSDLAWMVGTWTGSGKISFGGNETEIKTTMTAAFDGMFLKINSTDESTGFKMTKTVMVGWDSANSEYVTYTFTNIAPDARIAHGKPVDGMLQTVSDPWEAEGMKATTRETVSKVSATQCGYKIEFKQGDNFVTGMDFVLTKK